MKTSRMALVLGFMLTAIGGGALANGLLVDPDFDDGPDSVGLRANSAGQDWYESRKQKSDLLTLDDSAVGGNATPKAKFNVSIESIENRTGNAYLTQEFSSTQRQGFSARWDIYVDSIVALEDQFDRAGWMLIGDDIGTDPDRTGPNAEDSERFVYMAFHKEGGGTTGTMDLVARDKDDPWSTFTTVATGLKLKQWHTIQVNLDLIKDTYEVYVNGRYEGTVDARTPKTSVMYISFAQWHDGAGTFYVDNVTASFTSDPGTANKIVYEWWMNIPGTSVRDLTSSPDYPNNPTGRELLDVFESPVDRADNYGTRMYGWLKPHVTGEYRFWIAGDDHQQLWLSSDEDPANAMLIAEVPGWTAFRQWDKYPGQSGAGLTPPLLLEAGRKYYIEALGKEGEGGDSTAVAWQPPGEALVAIPGQYVDNFGYAPVPAFSPRPPDGAVLDVVRTPQLEWAAGEKVLWHDVYFGDDKASVANATRASVAVYRGRQPRDNTSYSLPDDLGWDETYYWRVDEVDADGTIRRGKVWSFTTADYIVVDDFENYNNDLPTGKVISQNWSADLPNVFVGYSAAPYAERTAVHVGKQAMPVFYSGPAVVSRTFNRSDDWTDWTVKGVNTLSLWYRGYSTNVRDDMYIVITDDRGRSVAFNNPDPDAVLRGGWTNWAIPLDYFRSRGVELTEVNTLSIGFGDSESQPYEGPRAVPVSVVSDGDQQVDLDSVTLMKGPATLKGHVRNTLTGRPITNGNIVFTKIQSGATTRSSPSPGSSFIVHLGDGEYRISVEADGYPKRWLEYKTENMGMITKRDVLLMPETAPQLGRPVFRFRSPVGSWYFTVDPLMRDDLLYDETVVPNSKDWTYEGIAFCDSGTADEPVYLLWCGQGEFTPYPSYPFYTMDADEKDRLLKGAQSYLYEDRDIAFHAYSYNPGPPSCKPVYWFRSASGYFYTISEEERERWKKHPDWEDLGIAWYAFDYGNVDDLNMAASP